MASVSKRRWTKPDGSIGEKWVVRFVDRKGIHRQKTYEKKKDAERYRAQVAVEAVERGFGTFIEDATIDRVSREFLESEEHRMNDGRIGRARYEVVANACRKAIRPHLGKMKMTELRGADVERWYSDLRKVDGLSLRTAKDRVRDLKLMCDFAVRQGYCRENAAKEAQPRLRGGAVAKVRNFSREDLGALLRAAEMRRAYQHERSWAHTRCMVHLAAFCGLRYGEILGLAEKHVVFGSGVIEVRSSLTEYGELKGPKTEAGVRDIPMPAHLAAMLRDWLDRWAHPHPQGLIFMVGEREEPKQLSAANFHNQRWRPLLQAAGLGNTDDPFHFHALRHFAASWWIMNGLPLTDTASLMGHSKVDMTLQVYAHALTGGTRRTAVLEGMSQALLGTVNGTLIEHQAS